MNEKFNKNAKVEQLTKVVLSHGEEKGLIVKDPLSCGRRKSYIWRPLEGLCTNLDFIVTRIKTC